MVNNWSVVTQRGCAELKSKLRHSVVRPALNGWVLVPVLPWGGVTLARPDMSSPCDLVPGVKREHWIWKVLWSSAA